MTDTTQAAELTLVDGGALQMALNVLRRAGKQEVADALEGTAIRAALAAQAVPSDDARDAARYRFVRTADKVAISAEAARDPVVYDAAIDAAMASQKAGK